MSVKDLKDWLLPYQWEWVIQDHPRELIRKSRRTGMTLTQALKMVLRCDAGTDQNVLSLREDSSKLVLDDCSFWLDWLADHGMVDLKEWKVQALSIENLRLGTSIVALPAVPRLLRGRKGDVFIDEAAWIPNLPDMIAAAQPLAMWGGRISLVSSVFPVPNHFTQLSQDPSWKVSQIDLYQAVDQGLYRKIQSVAGYPVPTAEDEQNWISGLLLDAGQAGNQEYLCIEQEGDQSWVSTQSKLRSLPVIQVDKVEDLSNLSIQVPHSLAIDVGGTGSITSIAASSSDQLELLIDITGLRQPEIASMVKGLINRNTRAIAIDTNGIGLGLYDLLHDDHRVILHKVPNTSQWFRLHCLSYLNAIYSGDFQGTTDPIWMSDHRGVQISKGNVTMSRSGNRHCDLVPACAMAYQHRPISSTLDIWQT